MGVFPLATPVIDNLDWKFFFDQRHGYSNNKLFFICKCPISGRNFTYLKISQDWQKSLKVFKRKILANSILYRMICYSLIKHETMYGRIGAEYRNEENHAFSYSIEIFINPTFSQYGIQNDNPWERVSAWPIRIGVNTNKKNNCCESLCISL